MEQLNKIRAAFDSVNNFFAGIADVLIIFTMVIICIEVVMRYFVGTSIIWVFESTAYAMLFITFLATAWLLKQEGHTVLDFVLIRLSSKPRVILNVITSIIGALICLVVVWYGTEVTLALFQKGIREQSAVNPPSFALYFVIPLGSLLLFIQFLRRAYGYLGKWKVAQNQEQEV